MRWFAAASLALFLTLSLVATAQIRGMPITPDQRMQLGTAPGSVRAGSSSGIHIGGTFSRPSAGVPPGIHVGNTVSGPSVGFGNPYFYRRRYYRTFGVVSPYGPYNYGGYVPYAWDYGADPAYTGYVGGTFDASPGYTYPPQYATAPSSYSPDNAPPPQPQSYQQRRSGRDSDESAEPTVLVFRDGHRQEIANYAIMGATLFVLSGPRSRIPIAELDIPATERVNQDRGVDFHVPTKAQ